jgi:hypothetical protein
VTSERNNSASHCVAPCRRCAKIAWHEPSETLRLDDSDLRNKVWQIRERKLKWFDEWSRKDLRNRV